MLINVTLLRNINYNLEANSLSTAKFEARPSSQTSKGNRCYIYIYIHKWQSQTLLINILKGDCLIKSETGEKGHPRTSGTNTGPAAVQTTTSWVSHQVVLHMSQLQYRTFSLCCKCWALATCYKGKFTHEYCGSVACQPVACHHGNLPPPAFQLHQKSLVVCGSSCQIPLQLCS